MARISATLLFAGIATAQAANYTTTVWMTNFAGTDKYGYVASVIDADAEHMTLSMDFDSDTNTTVLNIGGPGGNYTIGKTGFTVSTDMSRLFGGASTSGDFGYQVACTQPAEAAPSVTCALKVGDALDGDLDARKRIAQHVRNAAQNTGFFYVQNHGIDHELIEDALTQAKAFFAQSPEQKELLSSKYIGFGVSYRGVSSSPINRTWSRDALPSSTLQAPDDYD
ncbi:hypothetical protein SLS61_004327 [Didymella pomorum]